MSHGRKISFPGNSVESSYRDPVSEKLLPVRIIVKIPDESTTLFFVYAFNDYRNDTINVHNFAVGFYNLIFDVISLIKKPCRKLKPCSRYSVKEVAIIGFVIKFYVCVITRPPTSYGLL